MLIRDLTLTQCADVLERTPLARLACVKDAQPYIVPIHASFDAVRRCLYSVSPVGQKVEWMRENPLVCVEFDDIADKDHWQTVLVYGRFEELGDSSAHADARRRALALFEKRSEWWLPATGRAVSRHAHAAIVYCIHIDRMTGRRASRGAGTAPAP